MAQAQINELRRKASLIRRETLEMICSAGKGHIGGAFSCMDILVTLYYGKILRFDASKRDWKDRDRFILSKGHSAAALYAILCDLGYFPRLELLNYQKKDCILRGHPDRKIPGIEADTGSLGHGLGIGAGLALSAKMDGKDFMTVVLMGDGECCEGSVWEAAMFAARRKLNNLIGIVDKNGLSATDFLKDCSAIDPLDDKWKAFGWDVVVVNGHSFEELLSAFSGFRDRKSGKPLMIIADTVKGKGVSFMEGCPEWHHAVPNKEQYELARIELDKSDGGAHI